ncbi:MAG: hypothetical protein ACLGI9_09820 [Thermoanaerobaculia bacterium]
MNERALAPLLVLSAITALALAGCASPAPSSSPHHVPPLQTREPDAPPPPAAATLSLACDPAARRIPFPSIGIPAHTRILDIALTPDRVWLLADQHHIVEVTRNPEQPTFRTITGREDATWDALAVDPVDSSLWVVSLTRLELIHLDPDGRSTIVKIPRLEGEGGFRDVLVDEEGVFVVPTCAEDALWKVDRTGKLLERAFHREEGEPLTLRTEFTPEEGQGSVSGCFPVSLGRDLSGRVTVLDGVTRSFYRKESGTWTPVLEVPDPEMPAGGVRVDNPGTENAVWFPGWGAAGNTPDFFFLGEGPLFQPQYDFEASRPGLLQLNYLRPGTEGMTTAVERCKVSFGGGGIQVVSDEHGYVTWLDNQLVLGSFGGGSSQP